MYGINFLIEPVFYNWLILAGVLFIIEVSSFIMIFLWFALAAILMSILTYFIPSMSFPSQLIIYAFSSTLLTVSWFLIFEKKKQKGNNEMVNNRANRYTGKLATLIVDSDGLVSKVNLEDSFWKVQLAEEMPKGTKVKIVGSLDGLLLKAERYER